MFIRLLRQTARLPLVAHALLIPVAFGYLNWVQGPLNASYAASKHPVAYYIGQTRFSGTMVKSYYATMQDAGTLGIYWKTQFIDFGFIFAVFIIGLLLGGLLTRLARPGSLGEKLGLTVGVMLMTASCFDMSENLISFVMLADYAHFPNWIAIPYSTIAAAKFALIVLGMLTSVVTILTLLAGRVLRKPTIG